MRSKKEPTMPTCYDIDYEWCWKALKDGLAYTATHTTGEAQEGAEYLWLTMQAIEKLKQEKQEILFRKFEPISDYEWSFCCDQWGWHMERTPPLNFNGMTIILPHVPPTEEDTP